MTYYYILFKLPMVLYDGERQDPNNIDCGLVQTDTGIYFDSIDELEELAKTAAHPISDPYTEGETKYFKEGEEVTP
ncbi:hypothetical protein [Wukongibacter sp. M2B1]|uniref:hypothetical protein n=1 Tax=Wukongibacter sp. M2B1 TaxID=3088895 RepID=UPI003D7A13FD